MRRENATWLLAIGLIIAFGFLPGFVGQVQAAQEDVTMRWNIPQDLSFSVSYAPTHTRIDFDPASGTFTDLKASDQTDAQWAYRLTNDGNVNLDFSAEFTSDFPGGVTEFKTCDASSGDAPSGACWWWDDTNETTQQTIVSALTPASDEDLWGWATGSGVAEGIADRTYRLISTASA